MKKYTIETIVGVFMLIGIIAISYMAVSYAGVDFLSANRYSLVAKFNTVTGLKSGADVEMLGLKIGNIRKLTMDQDNQQAVVELKIEKGILLYDDAIASIKTRGLIGDQYISIDPGGGGDLLKAGDTIVDTESPIDIMELVSKYAFGDVEK